MRIAKDTVVSVSYELFDARGELVERSLEPVDYLHGGYDSIFPLVEAALDGKAVGDECEVRMEPEDAFGDYDAELIRIEPLERFPDGVSVGTQFEGVPEGATEHMVYTVTDIADDRVVVDGNHPLAGIVLVFRCKVADVRKATEDEISHRHVHANEH